MLEQMYWVCSDCLTLAMQLGSAQDLPAPQVLRQRITGLLEAMNGRAAEAGIQQNDLNEALYAIVAFMDEQILRSQWSGRQQWMSQPLQLTYFNENTAGEGFFQRMQAIEQRPNQAHVLEIYYLCLALGFRGKYALQAAGDLDAVEERVGSALNRQVRASDEISPHGYQNESVRGFNRRPAPLVLAGAGFFALALIVFIVLKVVNAMNASAGADEIRHSAPGQIPAPVSLLPHVTSAGRG
ncbi:MAG TPA: type IVB secretion system protein IcmH/DotU [Polyangiaceae bacterium]|nr:type IVB secretion system protein IcmH/DotU [Polyangiaceae bacterium]